MKDLNDNLTFTRPFPRILNCTDNQSLMTYLFWFPSLLKPLNSAAAFLEAARPGLDLVIDYT